jgi:hypothetical protein
VRVRLMPNKPNYLAILVTLVVPILLATNAYASSPYDSGYDHGCDDAGESPSDMYINEPGKGPNSHTDVFMNGYTDGYRACGGVGHPEATPENIPICNYNDVLRLGCELGDWVYRNSK